MVGSDVFPIEIVPLKRGHSFVFRGVIPPLLPHPRKTQLPETQFQGGQEVASIAGIDWNRKPTVGRVTKTGGR